MPTENALYKLFRWDEENHLTELKPYCDIVIDGIPFSILRMEHNIGMFPTIVNGQSIVFIILMSVFILCIVLFRTLLSLKI